MRPAKSLARVGSTITNPMRTLVCLPMLLSLGSSALAQSELREAANELSVKLHKDEALTKLKGERILIAEFDNVTGKGDVVPRTLQEMLTTAFIKAKHFKVVERAQMDKALKELRLSLSDLVDPENRKKLGKLVGAAHIVVGSISEGSTSVSVDARIVDIETGESIAAEDASIKTDGKKAPGAVDVPPDTKPKDTEPKVDLNLKGTTSVAGEWLDKKPGMGLMGGTDLRIVWREKLDGQPVVQGTDVTDTIRLFRAGNLIGNGTSRLALVRGSEYGPVLEILRWQAGRFGRTAEVKVARCFLLRVVPTDAGRSILVTSHERYGNYWDTWWRWDGTCFAAHSLARSMPLDSVSNRPGQVLWRTGYGDYTLAPLAMAADAPDQMATAASALGKGTSLSIRNVIAADVDADGHVEFVGTDKEEGGRIRVIATSGREKAVTSTTYGARLATWALAGSKLLYIVAPVMVQDGETTRGTAVVLIQFDGESYVEVWKSSRLGDEILDLQVCDPKNEGRDGLVVLVRDGKGYYLTKIVSE